MITADLAGKRTLVTGGANVTGQTLVVDGGLRA